MIPTAGLDSVEVLWADFFPLVGVQVIQEDLTVDRPVGAVYKTTCIARSTIDAQIVLVWHHDVVGSIWVLIEPVLIQVFILFSLFRVHRLLEVQTDLLDGAIWIAVHCTTIARLAALFEVCRFLLHSHVLLVDLSTLGDFAKFNRILTEVLDVRDGRSANSTKHEHTSHARVECRCETFPSLKDVLL